MTNPRTLLKGCEGADVKALQEQLVALGYGDLVGRCDGDFGPKLEAAMRRFQEDYGLKIDGKAGEKSFGRLRELRMEMAMRDAGVPQADQDFIAQVRAKYTKPREWGHALLPTFALDDGHGMYLDDKGNRVKDPGCIITLPDGTTVSEPEVTGPIMKKLAAYLSTKGAQVILTRDEHTVLGSRFDARHEAQREAHVFVSLHADSTNPKAKGMMVFHHTHAGSESVALAAALGGGKTRQGAFKVLDPEKLATPSALVEVGNMRNAADLANLRSEEGQDAMAKRIGDGLLAAYEAMRAKDATLPILETQLAALPVKVGASRPVALR